MLPLVYERYFDSCCTHQINYITNSFLSIYRNSQGEVIACFSRVVRADSRCQVFNSLMRVFYLQEIGKQKIVTNSTIIAYVFLWSTTKLNYSPSRMREHWRM